MYWTRWSIVVCYVIQRNYKAATWNIPFLLRHDVSMFNTTCTVVDVCARALHPQSSVSQSYRQTKTNWLKLVNRHLWTLPRRDCLHIKQQLCDTTGLVRTIIGKYKYVSSVKIGTASESRTSAKWQFWYATGKVTFHICLTIMAFFSVKKFVYEYQRLYE